MLSLLLLWLLSVFPLVLFPLRCFRFNDFCGSGVCLGPSISLLERTLSSLVVGASSFDCGFSSSFAISLVWLQAVEDNSFDKFFGVCTVLVEIDCLSLSFFSMHLMGLLEASTSLMGEEVVGYGGIKNEQVELWSERDSSHDYFCLFDTWYSFWIYYPPMTETSSSYLRQHTFNSDSIQIEKVLALV